VRFERANLLMWPCKGKPWDAPLRRERQMGAPDRPRAPRGSPKSPAGRAVLPLICLGKRHSGPLSRPATLV